jgi:hypothetical protein
MFPTEQNTACRVADKSNSRQHIGDCVQIPQSLFEWMLANKGVTGSTGIESARDISAGFEYQKG